MKVRFLKDHVQHKEGEEADVHDARGNYFILCNVAEEVLEKQVDELVPPATEEEMPQAKLEVEPEKKDLQPSKEKKELTPKKEKKEK